MPTQKFVVPNETISMITQAMVCNVISSVSDGWGEANGTLRAPSHLLVTGEALKSTKLVFGSSIDKMVDSTDINKKGDIIGLLFRHQKPTEIWFGDAGFGNCEILSTQEVRWITQHFINLEYRGRISFSYRPDDEVIRHLDIWLPEQKTNFQAQITISWKTWWQEQYKGEYKKMILPFIEICEKLKLTKQEV